MSSVLIFPQKVPRQSVGRRHLGGYAGVTPLARPLHQLSRFLEYAGVSLIPAELRLDDPPLGCGHLIAFSPTLGGVMPMAEGSEVGIAVVGASFDVIDLWLVRSQASLPTAEIPLALAVVSAQDPLANTIPVRGQLAAALGAGPSRHSTPDKRAPSITFRRSLIAKCSVVTKWSP